MQQPLVGRTAECARAVREEHEGDGGGQCEAGPRGKSAQVARAQEADRKSDLAAGRTGQKLTQSHEIRVGLLVEPPTAHDEFLAEVAEVSDRSPETCDTEPQKDQQNFQWRTRWTTVRAVSLPAARHRSLAFLSHGQTIPIIWAALALCVLEERHKAEVHVQLLVAVEERQSGIIGDEIELEFLKAAQHHHVLDHTGGRLTGDARQFETMTVQM